MSGVPASRDVRAHEARAEAAALLAPMFIDASVTTTMSVLPTGMHRGIRLNGAADRAQERDIRLWQTNPMAWQQKHGLLVS